MARRRWCWQRPRDKPDLILLDVMMPGMDGYEVCRRLKANPVTRDIPVIFPTAKTDIVDEEKRIRSGGSRTTSTSHSRLHSCSPESRTSLPCKLRSQKRMRRAIRPTSCSMRCFRKRRPMRFAPLKRDSAAILRTWLSCFCDVTNFTSYCDKHEPEDVVSRLDALFCHFRADHSQTRARKNQNHRRWIHGGRRAP